MPRNGSGTYSKPANTDAVSGQTIESVKFNTLTDDIEQALTDSLAASGETPLTGNLPMGSNKLTGLAAGSGNGDSVRYEQVAKLAGDTFTGDVVLFDGDPTSVRSSGYRGAPQVDGAAKNAAYTFVLDDAGKHIFHDEVTARIYTIPANSSVAFPIGTVITIANNASAGNITLAITTDTLRRGDAVAGTGSRTIAASSVASILKTKSTEWMITGAFT